jgi:hypothetical protein
MLADWWRHAPEGSCRVALDAALDTDRAHGDDRARRYAAERAYRVLHRWRNAGLLAGRPMPWLDPLTPRRWDRDDLFSSDGAYAAHLGALRDAADDLGRRLAPSDFAAPAAYVATLARARAGLADVIDRGSSVTVAAVDGDAMAVRFDGRNGAALIGANVGDEPVQLSVDGTWTDVSDGRRVKGEVALAAHGCRLLRSS